MKGIFLVASSVSNVISSILDDRDDSSDFSNILPVILITSLLSNRYSAIPSTFPVESLLTSTFYHSTPQF